MYTKYATMEDHCSFSLLAKNLKKRSFEVRSLNHFGIFYPDPILLAELFNSLLLPLLGKEHRIRIKKFENHLRITLQNFVFSSFWPVTKMEDD